MELTRFKRYLRQVGGEWCGAALEILDAVDVARELADENEHALSQGMSVDEADVCSFVQKSVNGLVFEMTRIEMVGADRLLDYLIEAVGYDRVSGALAAWKKADDDWRASQKDELGDLDAHPF